MKALLLLSFLILGCVSAPEPNPQQSFDALLKGGFQANGIATLERLVQDESNALCSDPAWVNDSKKDPERAKLEATAEKTIVYPKNFMGDWQAGERLAQSGRGMTWTDKATDPNGGNCYNCHQLDVKEISYGTMGPSLYQYGKKRGMSEDTLRYTWGKLYNARATNACSNMPRFGHKNILTEKQMQDLMALLLDPKSPVNQ